MNDEQHPQRKITWKALLVAGLVILSGAVAFDFLFPERTAQWRIAYYAWREDAHGLAECTDSNDITRDPEGLFEPDVINRDNRARARRLVALAGRRCGASGFMIQGLTDQDIVVRRFCAKALGYSGDTKVVSALGAALEDEDCSVRCQAALSLGRLGGREAALVLMTYILRSLHSPEGLTPTWYTIGYPSLRCAWYSLLQIAHLDDILAEVDPNAPDSPFRGQYRFNPKEKEELLRSLASRSGWKLTSQNAAACGFLSRFEDPAPDSTGPYLRMLASEATLSASVHTIAKESLRSLNLPLKGEIMPAKDVP